MKPITMRHGIVGILFVIAASASVVCATALSPNSALASDDEKPAGAANTSDKQNEKKSEPTAESREEKKLPALSFKMKDIEGRERDLRDYYGQVVLMVNVASRCGLTPQYEQLQAVFKKYADQGFVILAFPANNFGAQEPGPNDQIKTFCTTKFNVTFPLFAKVSVKGDDICELYRYLIGQKTPHHPGGDIEWNFAKFVLNRKGELVERFDPRLKPDDKKVEKVIETCLAEPAPESSPYAKKLKEARESREKDAAKGAEGHEDGSRKPVKS